jgi:hypothetical protein
MDSRQLASKTPGAATRSTAAKSAAKRAAEHPMVQLQRLLGNQQVQRLIAQREEAAEQEDEEMVQAKADPGAEGGALSAESTAQIQGSRGQGAPLEPTLQLKMESGFGTSFGDVRVHSDSQSAALNQSMGSRAFTTGSDIYLRGDSSPNDSHLLAHELTHVVQQRSMGGGGGGGMQVGAAGDGYEQEADSVASSMASIPTPTAAAADAQREMDETAPAGVPGVAQREADEDELE